MSSGVPTETRRCSVIGGNGRPTMMLFFLNSSITGCTGRPIGP